MAVDGKPEPPKSVAEWEAWADACIQTNCRDWLPDGRPTAAWPRWQPIEGLETQWEAFWAPTAENHPFKGALFCWRCVAEAQGIPASQFNHLGTDDPEDVCWGGSQAEGDPSAEDPEPDPGQGGQGFAAGGVVPATEAWITKLDPKGNPKGNPIPSTRQRLFGPGPSLEDLAYQGRSQAVDTGTIFYVPANRTVELHAEGLSPEALRAYWGAATPEDLARWKSQYQGEWPDPEPPEADQPERTAQPDPEPVQADHRDTWPPSWTDDEPGTPPGNARPEPDPEPQP